MSQAELPEPRRRKTFAVTEGVDHTVHRHADIGTVLPVRAHHILEGLPSPFEQLEGLPPVGADVVLASPESTQPFSTGDFSTWELEKS
eukprot:7556501-Pyramimonas_sp.AAC.1